MILKEVARGTYSGWFCDMFYGKCNEDAPVVVDLFTDTPDPMSGDPGCVIHAGTGRVDLMIVSVDDPKTEDDKPILYAGPVASHFEFAAKSGIRLTDNEWKRRVVQPPSWIKPYTSIERCGVVYTPHLQELATDDEMAVNITEDKYMRPFIEMNSPDGEPLKTFKVSVKKSGTVGDIIAVFKEVFGDGAEELNLCVTGSYDSLQGEWYLWECGLLLKKVLNLTYRKNSFREARAGGGGSDIKAI
eukprot:TRINITY_DN11844_c0_g1_i1.p1 TRINITY_DN11844_c0_g1~~TRINITY_DN11844_c0_g1_i1.p1  ORF type:complete len:244 (-),score=65.37 TRINITY_DN11844_c0_g1_i1:158-889(-)